MEFLQFCGHHLHWKLFPKKAFLHEPDRYGEQSSLQVNSYRESSAIDAGFTDVMPNTIIGWLVFSMSSIAKRLRSFNAISALTASMSSSDISSASANLWRCVDVRRENRLLICWAVLYSSGRKVGRPSSFVRIFISLATCKGNARISLVSSSCPPLSFPLF